MMILIKGPQSCTADAVNLKKAKEVSLQDPGLFVDIEATDDHKHALWA